MPGEVLAAVIACPGRPGWTCSFEFEGTWLVPEDPEEESPADEMQLCPECGHCFMGRWPGFVFRREV